MCKCVCVKHHPEEQTQIQQQPQIERSELQQQPAPPLEPQTTIRITSDDKSETSARHTAMHLERVLKKHKLRTIDLEIALNDMDDSMITPQIGRQLQHFMPSEDQVEAMARLKSRKMLKRDEEPFWRLSRVSIFI